MRFTLQISISIMVAALTLSACKSAAVLTGPVDETKEAGEMVHQANLHLKEIKKLYEKNENKREEIKQAMTADDVATVKKLANEVNDLINQGTKLGEESLKLIDEAQEKQINDDYKEYLRLKYDALKEQLAAFDEYRQAALILRDRFDPKDAQERDAVRAEFKSRSEKYQRRMEKARDRSTEANELAKRVQQQKTAE